MSESKRKVQPFLRDLRLRTKQVGDRLTKVIVLKETERGVVFIPLNGIRQVDYDRLKELYENTKNKQDLLDAMKETTANNGRNILVVYQDIIRNVVYKPRPEGTGYYTKEGEGDFEVTEPSEDKVNTTDTLGSDTKKIDDDAIEKPEDDLDKDGEPWNPDVHVASKAKTNDGRWRRKPGAKPKSDGTAGEKQVIEFDDDD